VTKTEKKRKEKIMNARREVVGRWKGNRRRYRREKLKEGE
jgi:hypothetical protein